MTVWKVEGSFARSRRTTRCFECVKRVTEPVLGNLSCEFPPADTQTTGPGSKGLGNPESCQSKHQFGNRKVVPDCLLVQSTVIDAKPQLCSLLQNKQHRRGPGDVLDRV